MKQIEVQTLNRKQLQEEGLDFLFQYHIYTRKKKDDEWIKQQESITSYEPEEREEKLKKQQLFRMIVVPFRFTEEDMLNQIKLDDDWVPVLESNTIVTKEELENKNVEVWKNE